LSEILKLVCAAMAASAIVLTSSGFGLSGQQAVQWLVRGEAVVTCPCKVPCPCRSNAPPSQPHCENLSYVRIVEGNYGTTKLDGLEYVWAADECTGTRHPRKPTTLYFPRAATAKQISAVENVMTGEQCAHAPKSEMRSKRVDLSAGAAGPLYSVRAASLLRIDVDIAPGPVPMEPLPALDSWSNTVTYARNITARIDDPQAGLKWDYSGLQANYRTFEMSSTLIEKGLMLAIYRDDSGRFNEMQRGLIRELHLEVPLNRDEFQAMLAQVRASAKAVPDVVGKDLSGAVAGTVYGTDGKPRSGARIGIAEPSAAAPIAVSNAEGRYFISRVSPGAYQMCALRWDGQTAEKSCAPVSVKAGFVLRQDLKLGAVAGN
jgi:hypothetical protein